MEEILKQAEQNKVPIVRPKTLQLLLDKIRETKPKEILEIGTAIGYSAANMLLASNANLTTIELNENSQNLAKQNLSRLNLSNRVTFILGDAKNVLKDLLNQNKRFNFVFLDGPKGQYINYLPTITNLLNDGGVIFADDVLFRGMVNGDEFVPHSYRTIVVNLRKYLAEVNNPPYTSQVLDIEDGICISKKTGEKKWLNF